MLAINRFAQFSRPLQVHCFEAKLWLVMYLTPLWPSGKASDYDVRPVVKARFEPRHGRPLLAPTCNGVRVCSGPWQGPHPRSQRASSVGGGDRAHCPVPSLSGTLNFRINFCNCIRILRLDDGIRASTTSFAWCRI